MRTMLAYDKQQVAVEIDDRNFVGSLVSRIEDFRPGKAPEELLEAAFDHPIGSPKLEDVAKGKKNIVIISSDHTRPVPSKLITPIMLRRIRTAQPDANIRILVAAGPASTMSNTTRWTVSFTPIHIRSRRRSVRSSRHVGDVATE